MLNASVAKAVVFIRFSKTAYTITLNACPCRLSLATLSLLFWFYR